MSYFEPLTVFAKAYLEDGETAKDMVQEVFANLWHVRASLPPDVNLKSYLYQATRNNCLNYIKKLKVQAKYEKRTLDSYHDVLLNYEALIRLNFDILSFDELKKQLEAAIGRLPKRCRDVFELSRFEGMKNREIAAHLNISVKTVEEHISKALKELRKQLKSDDPSGIFLLLLLRYKRLCFLT